MSNNGLSQITENEDDENLDYQYTTEKKKNSVDSSDINGLNSGRSLKGVKKGGSFEATQSAVKRRTSLELQACGKKKTSEDISSSGFGKNEIYEMSVSYLSN